MIEVAASRAMLIQSHPQFELTLSEAPSEACFLGLLACANIEISHPVFSTEQKHVWLTQRRTSHTSSCALQADSRSCLYVARGTRMVEASQRARQPLVRRRRARPPLLSLSQ